MTQIRPFHLAFPVDDLEAARKFYAEILGCPQGRSSDKWIDFNLFGHQIVAHLAEVTGGSNRPGGVNPVDGHQVPVPHFGVVLSPTEWEALAARVKDAGVDFIIKPHTRFVGETGEQSTMFFLDPAGNALEFKSFEDMEQLFAQ